MRAGRLANCATGGMWCRKPTRGDGRSGAGWARDPLYRIADSVRSRMQLCEWIGSGSVRGEARSQRRTTGEVEGRSITPFLNPNREQEFEEPCQPMGWASATMIPSGPRT